MDRLPSFVVDRLDCLIEHRDACKAWAHSALNRADADRQRVGSIKLDMQSRRGIGMPLVGTGYHPGPAQDEAQRQITELEAKIASSDAEFARRIEFVRASDHVLTMARDWLKRLPEQTVLERVPVPIANGDARKVLDLVRRELSEVQSKLARLRSLPPPINDIEAQVRAWVARKGTAQRLILRTPRHQPIEVHFDVASALGPTGAVRVDPLGLACLLNPDQMVDKLLVEARRHPFAAEGIGDEDYDEQVSELSAKLDQLGRSEEALISKLLQESATAVVRRNDVVPEHVLTCRVVAKRAVRAVAA